MLKRSKPILFIAVFVFTVELQALAAEEERAEHKESHYHLHHIGLFLVYIF